jgi:hypothetical protein
MKKITFLKVSCCILSLSVKCVMAQIPGAGLVGYFPFSGNANDQFGNGITGTPTTAYISANTPPVLAADRNGTANSAYDFEPSNLSSSFISLGQPSQFDFGTGSFSISLWMNYTVYQVSATMFANDAWHLAIRNLSGHDHLNFVIGGADFISDQYLVPGAWVNVVGVYDASAQTMQMYVNGTVATGFPWNGGSGGPSVAGMSTVGLSLNGTPTTTTQIGQIAGYPSTGIKGSLDEVLIYNRALTSAEVGSIYTAAGAPLAGIEENALAASFSVSPNPGSGLFHVTFSGKSAEALILKVYSMDGRLIEEHADFSLDRELDLNRLENGYYFLKMETKGSFYTQKVCIAH